MAKCSFTVAEVILLMCVKRKSQHRQTQPWHSKNL